LYLRGVARIFIALPVLDIDDAHYAVEDVFVRLPAEAIDFHGEGGRECRPGGLDDNAVGLDVGRELLQSVRELAYKIAAYAAVEQLLDAGNGLGRGQLRVDGDIAVFVLEERELVVLGQLLYQVQDQGCDVSADMAKIDSVPTFVELFRTYSSSPTLESQ
jgi:hypothetical protein